MAFMFLCRWWDPDGFSGSVRVWLCFAGPVMESPPAAAPISSSTKPKPAAPLDLQDASSLFNLLSKVDMSPADLLSALSKVQGQSTQKGEDRFLFKF